ncbi:Nucleolar essential protein-related [Dorcoceras hygrometricum]|uniref:Nucleolar essential protein-related n=1 Tax=Dorcoceras hygrometricum TaxID=472368 RepID=A0A2Z7BHM3_9LAMI|nr:Nucleolar essential protein-related [Dorcoceras hygrometricum]
MNSRCLESVAQDLVSAMMTSAYLLEKAVSSKDDKLMKNRSEAAEKFEVAVNSYELKIQPDVEHLKKLSTAMTGCSIHYSSLLFPRRRYLATEILDQVVPHMPTELDQIADAHLLPLQLILDTPLNYLGGVQTIYINFGRCGLFELCKPRDHLFRDMTPRQFKNILREMFLNERVLHPQSNEELARKVLDVDTFLAALPLNCRRIGVLSGPDPEDIAVGDLWEIVNSTNDDETLLFVV